MKWSLEIAYKKEGKYGYLLSFEDANKGINRVIECPDCGKNIIHVPQKMADFDNPLSSQLPREVECNCEEENDE